MKKSAFTLAEVLITLGIIGIVATMVIPGLIGDYKKSQYVSALKKTYAVLNEAIIKYETDNSCIGDLSKCGDFYNTNAATKWNAIIPYLKLAQDCGIENGCFPDTQYKYLVSIDGISPYNYSTDPLCAKGSLVNGTLIGISGDAASGSTYSGTGEGPIDYTRFFIDVNGINAPNQWGRDLFILMLTPTKLLGWSTQGCTPEGSNFRSRSGGGCAARIMREGWEMGY